MKLGDYFVPSADVSASGTIRDAQLSSAPRFEVANGASKGKNIKQKKSKVCGRIILQSLPVLGKPISFITVCF